MPVENLLSTEQVLYHDDHMLVVDKPAGTLSDATRDPERDHMVAAARRWLRDGGKLTPSKPGHDQDVRAVHRLDRDTSGVLILALTRPAAAALSAELAGRRARKCYLALVACRTREIASEWTVSNYLRHRKGRTVRVRSGGDPAETRFVLAGRDHDRALLEVFPTTGRTHQIRVHAADSTLPILGDPIYAPPEVGGRAPRLMLHAWFIEIAHPASGEVMRFTAPVPADLAALAGHLSSKIPG